MQLSKNLESVLNGLALESYRNEMAPEERSSHFDFNNLEYLEYANNQAANDGQRDINTAQGIEVASGMKSIKDSESLQIILNNNARHARN